MEPRRLATIIPCSTGLAESSVSRVKMDRPAVKPPAANPPTIKPTAKPTGRGKTGGKKLHNPSAVSARSKVGKSGMKKRKKASAGPAHPSVVDAGLWTSRQEQMEEVRAREPLYSTPRTGESGVDAVPARLSEGASASSGAMRRARRPWEWSAKECDMRVDALSCPKLVSDPASLEEAKSDDGSAVLDALGNGRSASGDEGDGLEETEEAGDEFFSQEQPSRRIRARSNTSKGRRSAGSGSINRHSGAGSIMPLRAGDDSATREEASSHERKPIERTAFRGQTNPRETADPTDGVSSNANLDDPGGRTNTVEDERTAKELSAELNRNSPRGHRSSESQLGNASARSSSSTGSGSDDDESEARDRARQSTETGDKTADSAIRSRLVINTDSSNSLVSTIENTTSRKRVKGHPWASKGLTFGNGTTAEVWWDDGKWYRVRLSSVSADGKHGVLEFLPYPRKTRAREFSTLLDLDEWISDGHLVLPGTHIVWD